MERHLLNFVCGSADIICSLQFKIYCIRSKKNLEVNFSFFTAVSLIICGLLLEIFSVFRWTIRRFGKAHNSHLNVREPKLHCEIGSNICHRNIWTLIYNKKRKTKRDNQKQKFLPEIGHKSEDIMWRDLIIYLTYFIKVIIVCCFLSKYYTSTFSHMLT